MSDEQSQEPRSTASEEPRQEEPRVVIVTPDGMGVSGGSSDEPRTPDRQQEQGHEREHEPTNPADLVEEPAKVMRIGSMIKQLLDEVRNAPLDPAGRKRLADIHHQSIEELKDGLAPELVEELDRIALPFTDESPSDPELRIAQAQLVGWLEGLFHGIQTALVAQQMAAQQQLQQLRALPPASPGTTYGQPPGMQPNRPGQEAGSTGQYL